MKFYIILDYPAIKIERMVYIMKNQKNTTLATEILREEVKRKRLWRIAFIVAFAVVIIDRIIGKGGVNNG